MQVRAKALASGAQLEVCLAAVELARSYGAAVMVNDRADLALLAGAAGVHVGQDDLPVAAARALLGPAAMTDAARSRVMPPIATRGRDDTSRAASSTFVSPTAS